MKYIAIAIGYLIIWILITPIVLIERAIKLVIILIKSAWHLKFNPKWMSIFDEYLIILPIGFIHPVFTCTIGIGWKVKNYKDVYLLRNYKQLIKTI